MHSQGEMRLISRGIEQQIGFVSLLTFVSFTAYNLFLGPYTLSWHWFLFAPVAFIAGTILSGLPMIVWALFFATKRGEFGTGAVSTLKLLGLFFVICAIPITWITCRALAHWMD
ncbi:MAG: hypothetical protein LC656_11885 [Sphingomonadales bacterium]|nr:hypothetical protein [Sphingomonadales bacterium]